MPSRAAARSISRPIREGLWQSPSPALHVLAVFERACDLVGAGEEGRRRVIGLVAPEIGDGPLNVVLDQGGWDFTAVEPGTRARIDGGQLQVGSLEVDLRQAEVWEPRPDWAALRKHRAAIAGRLPALRALTLAHVQTGMLLALLDAVSREDSPREAILAAARPAVRALKAGWGGDVARLREGAAQLAGLGSGLTPAGDDFLCGSMLWAWVAHPRPGSFCRAMAASAASRTTTLSAALLWAAAHGECSAAWHVLLKMLAHPDDVGFSTATKDVLAHGASSGADALAGFLWAGEAVR